MSRCLRDSSFLVSNCILFFSFIYVQRFSNCFATFLGCLILLISWKNPELCYRWKTMAPIIKVRKKLWLFCHPHHHHQTENIRGMESSVCWVVKRDWIRLLDRTENLLVPLRVWKNWPTLTASAKSNNAI